MKHWSLPEAVDAHLSRSIEVSDELIRINKRRLSGNGTVSLKASNYPVTAAWVQFAMSYGVTNKDGKVINAFYEEGATILGREQFVTTDDAMKNAPLMAFREQEMLSQATTLYVSAKISDLVTEAAELAEPEPIFNTDLLTPYGMVVLEKPVLLPDLHPDTSEMTDYLQMAIRAIGWLSVPKINHLGGYGPGVMLTLYTTYDDWQASYFASLKIAIKDGLLEGWSENDAIHPPETMLGRPRRALYPVDLLPWSFGQPWRTSDEVRWVPGQVNTITGISRRWFLTLMRFAWQRILVPEIVDPSPKLAKRINVATKKSNFKEYTILRLRRQYANHGGTGTGPKLAHRVEVAGHWRRQHFPSLGKARTEQGQWNQSSHRLIYIDRHWKGIGDIQPTHHVAALTR